MGDHTKVVVYLRAPDVRMLKDRGVEEVAVWVRSQVKRALALERELPEETSQVGITDITRITDA